MSTTIEARQVRRRLAILRHAEEVTGNVAMTCRYYRISRQSFLRLERRYDELGPDVGLSGGGASCLTPKRVLHLPELRCCRSERHRPTDRGCQ
jgi:hypothetical protein